MKPSTISTIQKELIAYNPKQLIDICLRLAKHKKENKELIDYLLFKSSDEESFITEIKKETDILFSEMNTSNVYLAKKTIRKVLRVINKQVKFSQQKSTEAELRIYYCKKLKLSGIKIHKSPVLVNLYNNQMKKIYDAISKMHEDLQHDFVHEIEKLELAQAAIR
jgi:hypothetical protein